VGRMRRWLYLDTYTIPDPGVGAPWSDAIGYGLTSSPAIRCELRRRGIDLVMPRITLPAFYPGSKRRRAMWINQMYTATAEEIYRDPPDVIFAFHIFVTFPTVIRKTLQDLSADLPIVGYSHGSHWDATDTYRFDLYPGLELLDLANMHVTDRLLLVSEYMRTTLGDSIGKLNEELARTIIANSRVVGLPIDTGRLDLCRTDEKYTRPTIIFNHAVGRSKQPGLFATVAADILAEYDVNVLFTRRFAPDNPEITSLSKRFGERVSFGNDMSLDDYYSALWRSDIQVSTATHESLGIATLEAMYARNCCALPNLGAYPEICGADQRVLYDAGRSGLTERLAYLIEHPSERRQIAEELSERAKAYRPGVVTERIIAAVDELEEIHR
jgi:glycosyltransferase involved in cell wall biosynthesis